MGTVETLLSVSRGDAQHSAEQMPWKKLVYGHPFSFSIRGTSPMANLPATPTPARCLGLERSGRAGPAEAAMFTKCI